MNYYRARQHQKTGKWKYTLENGGRIYEIGYCAREDCPGHDTEEEACRHYEQYMLDNHLHFYNPENPHTFRKCQECGEITAGFAEVGITIIDLCPDHQTKAVVAKHYIEGKSMSSY